MKRLLATVALVLANASGALADQTEGCAGATVRQTAVVNLAVGGTAATLIPHNGLKAIYLCAINVGPVPLAVNIALVYGTKTTTPCDTGTTGLFGGTAAGSTSWNFAVNGGLTYGNGVGIIGMVPAGQDLCVLQGAGQQPGAITYTQY